MAIEKRNRTVKLFYLGGLDKKRRPGKVTAGGNVFTLPPVGEYLELPEHFAKDLEAKHKYLVGDKVYPAFVRDPRVAAAVKAGRSPIEAQVAFTVENISDDRLMEELAKRGLVAVPSEDTEIEVAPKKPVAKPRAAAKSRSARKKTAPAVAVADQAGG